MRRSKRFSICDDGGEASFRLKGVPLPDGPSESGVVVVLWIGALSLSNRARGLLASGS